MEKEQPTTLESIEAEIKRTYAEANELATNAKADARAAVLRMADCGQYLLLARDHVKSSTEWIVGLGLDPLKASRSIYLARNRDQLELELWPADVAKLGAQVVGLLPPPPDRETNDSERSACAPNHWLAHAGKLQRSFNDLFTKKPIEQWREDERENVKLAIKPFVDLDESL